MLLLMSNEWRVLSRYVDKSEIGFYFSSDDSGETDIHYERKAARNR